MANANELLKMFGPGGQFASKAGGGGNWGDESLQLGAPRQYMMPGRGVLGQFQTPVAGAENWYNTDTSGLLASAIRQNSMANMDPLVFQLGKQGIRSQDDPTRFLNEMAKAKGPDYLDQQWAELVKNYGASQASQYLPKTWAEAQARGTTPLFRKPEESHGFFGDMARDTLEFASDPAMMLPLLWTGGTALQGGFGSLGAASGVAPEVGALYSGLDATALSGVDLAAAGGSASAGSSLAANQGSPGMWDWLDGISTDGIGDIPGYGGGMEFNPATDLDLSMIGDAGIPGYGTVTPDMVMDPSSLLFRGSQLWDAAKGLGKKFIGGAPSGSPDGGAASGFGFNMDTAFNATPFLLAAGLAKNQGDDLDGVLDQINSNAYRRAVLNPYDMDTGIGRNNLQQDLSLRGVSGSSFGRNDLTNYDYMRALGRGDLASKAQIESAKLEGNLINQRNTNTNLLLGAGLNASAGLFKGPDITEQILQEQLKRMRSDPFGLSALGG